MQSLSAIRNILKRPSSSTKFQTNPEEAYDIWASSYDSQPDNLMLAMDEQLFSGFIKNISIKGKTITDIGCGTGRHWKKLLMQEPEKLIGYDVSEGMLAGLKNKFPEAETYKLSNTRLIGSKNNSCDIILSTLTIAHIENIEEAFAEWNRVLRPDGEMIITDYHPELLSKGGNRTFKHNKQLIAVKNNIYPVAEIKKMASQFGWKQISFVENIIDEHVKHYYAKQNALQLFHQFKGSPVIYGIHLKKINASS
ncbi:MAG TPA: methyltransferase domain-containing protein [Puia sp.]|nr:methyltransferase domain-containing protein [Puia sp.]